MSEEVITVVEQEQPELFRHQLGKLVFGTIIGFGASKLAEKTYDALLTVYRQKRAGS